MTGQVRHAICPRCSPERVSVNRVLIIHLIHRADHASISDIAIFHEPFEYLRELQRHSPSLSRIPASVCRGTGHARAAARLLCFVSSDLAGRSLGRIVEEELIAIGIIDHQKPVAPRTLLDRNALGL